MKDTLAIEIPYTILLNISRTDSGKPAKDQTIVIRNGQMFSRMPSLKVSGSEFVTINTYLYSAPLTPVDGQAQIFDSR